MLRCIMNFLEACHDHSFIISKIEPRSAQDIMGGSIVSKLAIDDNIHKILLTLRKGSRCDYLCRGDDWSHRRLPLTRTCVDPAD